MRTGIACSSLEYVEKRNGVNDMKKLTASDNRRTITAREVMTRNPLSINETATIRDTAAFLFAKRMSAAPVINEAGRAVGVVSHSDIARHMAGEEHARPMDLPVRTIMNDEVLFVRPGTPIDNVIDDLLHCRVKRLFVADENDVLVGVISATDVLRYLNSPAAKRSPWSAGCAPSRRPVPSLPARPAPFVAAPRTGSDIVMAGGR
jgi:CBS domain-containing protein